MTSGIYLLEFSDYSFYIGRSGAIEKRIRSHLNMLSSGKHYNYKLQNKYLERGLPKDVIILEECSLEQQIAREIYWIEVYEATRVGLNISVGGDDFGVGESNLSAKHTNAEIEAAFKLIVDFPELSLKEVAMRSGVSYGIVREISKGTTHTWLQEAYPDEYAKMLSLKGTRVSRNKSAGASDRGIIYPKVLSPEGTVYSVTNARQFAIAYGLDDGSLNRLLHGRQKSHKGWTLAPES